MYDFIDLTGRQFVVTGASSGIGKQTAVTLSRLGARVILIARREDKLRETLETLEGEGHACYTADLADVDAIADLVKRICTECVPLDGLADAAGISHSIPLGQFSPQKIEEVFKVNYFGFIEMTRQISKKGRFNPGMRIVAVSSVAAVCGDPVHTAYSGSKAAIDGSIRCLAKELAPKQIALNSVAPAMTDTPMNAGFNARYGADSESIKYVLQRQYLGIADPQDVANAIAFLLSPAARFITGTCLYVDGGYTSC